MENLEIIKQLLNGNHLEPKELEQAKTILHGLQKQLESKTNLSIRKYINSSALKGYQSTLEAIVDCDYCLQNYSEEGDKTDVQIFTDHLESAIDAWQESGNEDLIPEAKLLLQIMEQNEIDFVSIN